MAAVILIAVLTASCSDESDTPSAAGVDGFAPTPILPAPPSGGSEGGFPTYSVAEKERAREIALADPWVIEAADGATPSVVSIVPWTVGDADDFPGDARGVVVNVRVPPLTGRQELPLRADAFEDYPYRHVIEIPPGPGIETFMLFVRLDLGFATEIQIAAAESEKEVKTILPWDLGDGSWTGPSGGPGALAGLEGSPQERPPEGLGGHFFRVDPRARSWRVAEDGTWRAWLVEVTPEDDPQLCVIATREPKDPEAAFIRCIPRDFAEHGFALFARSGQWILAIVPAEYVAVIDDKRAQPDSNVVFRLSGETPQTYALDGPAGEIDLTWLLRQALRPGD